MRPDRSALRPAESAEAQSGERLQKYLARAGVASRRASEEYILAGRVRVNGKVVKELGTRVDPDGDLVEFDGQPVVPMEREPLTYLLYKPTRLYHHRHRPARAAHRLEPGPRRRASLPRGPP